MVSTSSRVRLSLRIPAKIDEALKQEAASHCRSQNSLIAEILQNYVEEKPHHCAINDGENTAT